MDIVETILPNKINKEKKNKVKISISHGRVIRISLIDSVGTLNNRVQQVLLSTIIMHYSQHHVLSHGP